MPSHEAALVAEARRLARAQLKRLALRRQLREVDGEIKAAKKNLRALTERMTDPAFQPMSLVAKAKGGEKPVGEEL